VFYPIFSINLSGRAEGLCAEVSTNFHTFRIQKGYMRLISLIISRTEPRVFSPPHCPDTDSGVPRSVHRLVYPGWYTGLYYPGGIPAYYPGWYTRLLPWVYNLPCYPGCIASHATRCTWASHAARCTWASHAARCTWASHAALCTFPSRTVVFPSRTVVFLTFRTPF